MRRGRYLGPSAVLMSVLVTGGHSHAQRIDTRPPHLRNAGIDQRLNEQLPLDLGFRDESGNAVELRQYFGRKPVVLTFAYYECPMLCTMVLNGLVKAMRAISMDVGKDFEVINISINPREAPSLAASTKNTYVQEYGRPGAGSGWHFLTGDESAIRRAAAAAGYRYGFDPVTGQFTHASGIMVLTPEGKFSRYFYGVEFSARDLRLGLVEAAANQIGTPVDQVLLYCFHYDPVTGKYALVINNVIRIAGTGFALTLGALVLVLLRRERRVRSRASQL